MALPQPQPSTAEATPIASSFRDPSGFVFKRDGRVYRQVNQSYRENYEALMSSGLYQELVSNHLMVGHEELPLVPVGEAQAFKVIEPQLIPFLSHPQEWCFSQFKDAALLTLDLERRALARGMTLKDASAYNVQFLHGRPIFIDTLSFEKYHESTPWVAYRQFCQHFLAPLALMSKLDISLGKLPLLFIDGVPLELASKLLPRATKLSMGLLMHIHMHAKSQVKHANDGARRNSATPKSAKISKTARLGLIDSLISTVNKLAWTPAGTEWGDYYSHTNYTERSMAHKRDLVRGFIERAKPKTVWDLGANAGEFSAIAAAAGAHVVSFDIDAAAVEKHYRGCSAKKERNILPLLLDLTNPTPAYGWALNERQSFTDRGPVDCAMALALIHHLAISNNVPLGQVAKFFRSITERLIIEFVPKSDTQVKRLLASREDIFVDYSQSGFEQAFSEYFEISARVPVQESERTLYMMRGK